MPRRRALPRLAAALAGAAFLLPAGAARAGVLAASAVSCESQSARQVFLPWADPASYVLAPDGGLEGGGAGWRLAGGAAVTSGNEAFGVGGPTDSASLSLPAGSSATTAAMCVGLENPTMRFFARTSGSPTAGLRVEALYEDVTGATRSLTIGVLSAGPAWAPTVALPIVVNLLPLLPGSHTPVAFRFTPVGGSFSIDDVYVDPYGKN